MDASERYLSRIAVALEQLVQLNQPDEPNWRHQLADYAQFGWSSIGADVVQRDDYGVSAVSWGGHLWTRRSGAGKYGKAIWFSRPAGQDEDGTNYLRLITFKDLSPAEALPPGVRDDVRVQTSSTKNGRSLSNDPAARHKPKKTAVPRQRKPGLYFKDDEVVVHGKEDERAGVVLGMAGDLVRVKTDGGIFNLDAARLTLVEKEQSRD